MLKDFLLFLQRKNIEARLVGGAVRDYCLGLKPNDFDVAVSCQPKDLLFLNPKHSNLFYGTFQIVFEGQPINLSCLRKDRICYGRQAMVDFDASFEDDAKRRDFTINALYMDANNTIFDPLKTGLVDLKNGRIRFIGDPITRIDEDYLRLWRYYRFCALYSCEKSIETYPVLKKIPHSTERVRGELFKILSSHRAHDVIHYMPLLLAHHFESSPKAMSFDKNPLKRLYSLYPDLKLVSQKCALRSHEIRFLKDNFLNKRTF